jgi:hypothetical protein
VAYAHAEDIIPRLSWSVVNSPALRSIAPKAPEIIQVQEPFCEYGVGLCGGTCNEDGGKHWDCASTELPCYQLGHCKCEAASICKPPPVKKKK